MNYSNGQLGTEMLTLSKLSVKLSGKIKNEVPRLHIALYKLHWVQAMKQYKGLVIIPRLLRELCLEYIILLQNVVRQWWW